MVCTYLRRCIICNSQILTGYWNDQKSFVIRKCNTKDSCVITSFREVNFCSYVPGRIHNRYRKNINCTRSAVCTRVRYCNVHLVLNNTGASIVGTRYIRSVVDVIGSQGDGSCGYSVRCTRRCRYYK